MNHYSTRILLAFVVMSFLVGCSPPSTLTTPPTSAPPAPTHTLPPNTPTLESTPTKTPKPTRTPVQLGTFIGCTYFEGELVDGHLNFQNEYSDLPDLDSKVGSSGCFRKQLEPGIYEVSAAYWTGPCAVESGCGSELFTIEVKANEIIEMDFNIQQRSE